MNLSDIVKILEERPGMITPDKSILEAHFFINGFLMCKEMNCTLTDSECFFKKEFNKWIANLYNCNISQSWAAIILFNEGTQIGALVKFGELFNEFMRNK